MLKKKNIQSLYVEKYIKNLDLSGKNIFSNTYVDNKYKLVISCLDIYDIKTCLNTYTEFEYLRKSIHYMFDKEEKQFLDKALKYYSKRYSFLLEKNKIETKLLTILNYLSNKKNEIKRLIPLLVSIISDVLKYRISKSIDNIYYKYFELQKFLMDLFNSKKSDIKINNSKKNNNKNNINRYLTKKITHKEFINKKKQIINNIDNKEDIHNQCYFSLNDIITEDLPSNIFSKNLNKITIFSGIDDNDIEDCIRHLDYNKIGKDPIDNKNNKKHNNNRNNKWCDPKIEHHKCKFYSKLKMANTSSDRHKIYLDSSNFYLNSRLVFLLKKRSAENILLNLIKKISLKSHIDDNLDSLLIRSSLLVTRYRMQKYQDDIINSILLVLKYQYEGIDILAPYKKIDLFKDHGIYLTNNILDQYLEGITIDGTKFVLDKLVIQQQLKKLETEPEPELELLIPEPALLKEPGAELKALKEETITTSDLEYNIDKLKSIIDLGKIVTLLQPSLNKFKIDKLRKIKHFTKKLPQLLDISNNYFGLNRQQYFKKFDKFEPSFVINKTKYFDDKLMIVNKINEIFRYSINKYNLNRSIFIKEFNKFLSSMELDKKKFILEKKLSYKKLEKIVKNIILNKEKYLLNTLKLVNSIKRLSKNINRGKDEYLLNYKNLVSKFETLIKDINKKNTLFKLDKTILIDKFSHLLSAVIDDKLKYSLNKQKLVNKLSLFINDITNNNTNYNLDKQKILYKFQSIIQHINNDNTLFKLDKKIVFDKFTKLVLLIDRDKVKYSLDKQNLSKKFNLLINDIIHNNTNYNLDTQKAFNKFDILFQIVKNDKTIFNLASQNTIIKLKQSISELNINTLLYKTDYLDIHKKFKSLVSNLNNNITNYNIDTVTVAKQLEILFSINYDTFLLRKQEFKKEFETIILENEELQDE